MMIPGEKIIDREKKYLKTKKLIIKKLLDLSSEDRFILLSREIEDLSFKEISLITGKKSRDLRNHFCKLKEGLQKRLIKPWTKKQET